EVASTEPSIPKDIGGCLRIVSIATEHIWSAHPDLSRLAIRQPAPRLRIKNANFDSRQWQSYTAPLLLSLQGIRGINRGLGEPIALDQREAKALLEAAKRLWRERRRTTGQKTD